MQDEVKNILITVGCCVLGWMFLHIPESLPALSYGLGLEICTFPLSIPLGLLFKKIILNVVNKIKTDMEEKANH